MLMQVTPDQEATAGTSTNVEVCDATEVEEGNIVDLKKK